MVAKVSLNFRCANEKLVIPEDKGVIIISSVLAHMTPVNGSKGYAEISLGYKQLFTPQADVIAGELLWS